MKEQKRQFKVKYLKKMQVKLNSYSLFSEFQRSLIITNLSMLYLKYEGVEG